MGTPFLNIMIVCRDSINVHQKFQNRTPHRNNPVPHICQVEMTYNSLTRGLNILEHEGDRYVFSVETRHRSGRISQKKKR